MLAQYLVDNEFLPVIYVNGTYYGDGWDDICSHTWLVVEGSVIDITGDQFKRHTEPLKYDVPVYVGSMTEYYQLFEVGPGGRYKHFGLKKQWSNYRELKDGYTTMLKYLK